MRLQGDCPDNIASALYNYFNKMSRYVEPSREIVFRTMGGKRATVVADAETRLEIRDRSDEIKQALQELDIAKKADIKLVTTHGIYPDFVRVFFVPEDEVDIVVRGHA